MDGCTTCWGLSRLSFGSVGVFVERVRGMVAAAVRPWVVDVIEVVDEVVDCCPVCLGLRQRLVGYDEIEGHWWICIATTDSGYVRYVGTCAMSPVTFVVHQN